MDRSKTLISVHCYAGDQDRVRGFMPWYEHHGFPVCILSPEDAPVTFLPSVRLGKRAYIGQESLDRQRLHLEFLVQQPYDFFLMNDSDSLVLTPEIPKYVYEENAFWSNEVCDPRTHPIKVPRIAMQPPYFVSKYLLQSLVAVAPFAYVDPVTPYIDNWMVQLVYHAAIPHRSFENPVFAHPVKNVAGIQRFRDALKR